MTTASDPPEPAAPKRVVRRRRGLPSGRALLGALLIVVAGAGTYVVARADHDPVATRYAVIVRAVAPGARLHAGDVELRAMTLDHAVRESAITDAASVDGSIALAALAPGQLLQRGLVSPATTVSGERVAAAHEFAVPVPRDRTPPALRRGEHVAVLATYGSSSDAVTQLTTKDAVVHGYDGGDDRIGSAGKGRLTLAITDAAEVMATAHASQVAELTVVRTTQADQSLPPTFTRSERRPA
jgi:hypothetical protein